MEFIRFEPDWRGARVGAGVTLAPLAIWAVGTLPPPQHVAVTHGDGLPVAALVSRDYEPGTATAPLRVEQIAYYGGSISSHHD